MVQGGTLHMLLGRQNRARQPLFNLLFVKSLHLKIINIPEQHMGQHILRVSPTVS